jgi:hypothetical protein
MSGLTDSEIFTAHLGDPGNAPVGEFAIAADGKLELLAVDEPYRNALADIIDHVNGLETLRIKAPVLGDEPGGITREEVKRDDPQLTHAIVAFMEEKYNLYLEPLPK